MLDEILGDLKNSIAKAHEALKRDLGKVRTGRANAGMLDTLRVDYYGVSTPISQVATGKCRHDALDLASSVDAEGGASADEVDRAKKKAEELVSDGIRSVDSIIANKEKDILEV